MYKYFPHTESDLKAMFAKIGIKGLEDLYAELPEEVKFSGDYAIPSEMSELEVRQLFEQLGSQNRQLVSTITTHLRSYPTCCRALSS